MHHKDIKLIIRKQLKKRYPNWKRFNNKEKKTIAKKVLAEVIKLYDFKRVLKNIFSSANKLIMSSI